MNDLKKICQKCQKSFLVVEPEQAFLQKKGLLTPDNCPSCRQEHRLVIKGERKLIRTKCDNCQKEVVSTKNPSSRQKLFCEKCYLDFFNKVDLIIKDPLPE